MITDLRLQHFRSFGDASFELSPGVNIVVGPNASGKTNLLEALLMLARGGSYRARDSELVQFGRPWARLDAHSAASGHRTVKLVREPAPAKTYELDGRPFKRLNHQHSLPVVLFEPNHLRTLTAGPEHRRDYLDDLLEQTRAGYGSVRRQYRRALAQRNNLLKQSAPLTAAQLFPWDVRLSQLAGQIVRARHDLAARLSADLPALYRQLSKTKTAVAASYTNTWPLDTYESQLLKQLELRRADDQTRGFTGHGPHREDLLITFGGRSIGDVASRGEVRTATLALKILELRLLSTARDGPAPLLLLDDVFSELDGRRRHALTDHLSPYQTFITTTDADLVVQHFAERCNVIALS